MLSNCNLLFYRPVTKAATNTNEEIIQECFPIVEPPEDVVILSDTEDIDEDITLNEVERTNANEMENLTVGNHFNIDASQENGANTTFIDSGKNDKKRKEENKDNADTELKEQNQPRLISKQIFLSTNQSPRSQESGPGKGGSVFG